MMLGLSFSRVSGGVPFRGVRKGGERWDEKDQRIKGFQIQVVVRTPYFTEKRRKKSLNRRLGFWFWADSDWDLKEGF